MWKLALCSAPLIVACATANAQVACGSRPRIDGAHMGQAFETDANSKAQLFATQVSPSKLDRSLRAWRRDVSHRSAKSDEQALLLYSAWASCQAIMANRATSREQKQAQWQHVTAAFRLPSKPSAQVVVGPSEVSHINGKNCKSDGPDVLASVSANPGWKLIPESTHLVVDKPRNALPSFVTPVQVTDYTNAGTFYARHPSGGCAYGEVVAHLEATEIWAGDRGQSRRHRQ